MKKKIAIIQGHPDAHGNHYLHALAAAYANGAREAGSEVETIDVGNLDFPLLRSKDDFDNGEAPAAIQQAQEILKAAEHVVIFYPLWLGDMPALLKGFLEQTLRPKLLTLPGSKSQSANAFRGKSARIVITMGMPAFFYRWFYRAHTLKNLKRNILKFCGFSPVKESLYGMVDGVSDEKRRRWLAEIYDLGARAR